MWTELSLCLEGRIVRLEPLEERHREGLWSAARSDGRIWDWMHVRAGDERGAYDAWFEDALARAAERLDVPFATVDARDGTAAGSTRFLALRPEHRSVEIGWTWLASRMWNTGANVEAKLLMLELAIERAGCVRVEFKTDEQNVRSRRALEALPAQFEGVHRKHMLVRGGKRRDSAWYSVLDDEWPSVRANLERRLASRASDPP